jgi:hypothetical protein
MVPGQQVDLKQLANCVERAEAHLANLWQEIKIALQYKDCPGWEPDFAHYEIHLNLAKAGVGRAINILHGKPGNEQEE